MRSIDSVKEKTTSESFYPGPIRSATVEPEETRYAHKQESAQVALREGASSKDEDRSIVRMGLPMLSVALAAPAGSAALNRTREGY